MDAPVDDPEAFWAEVLSREPDRVRRAIHAVSDQEREQAVAHLRRISREPGWLPQQRESARAALASLGLPDPRIDGAPHGHLE